LRVPRIATDVAVSLEDTIKRRLRAVPDSPGIYMFRDNRSQVIYVGKALRLRDRLRSYFTPGYAETARVSELIRRATDFEFVTTANEVEALVLENNLIKNYRPRFNIRLKDDKNYLYLKLPVTEEFPRVHYSRRVQNDGALYFGPYTSAQSLRSTVKSIRQLLPFRTCSDEIFKQGKVVGQDGDALDGAADATEAELLRGFMLQYCSSATHVPRSVILPGEVEEPELITGWLSEKRGRPVTIEVPRRGRKRALVTQL